MGKTTSKTERDTDFVERIVGGHHYDTTISDGEKEVRGAGNTSKESQRIASDKWESSKGSSSSGSGGGGSKSGCYLTTACVNTLNLPDNCLELSVLRRFRDKILIPTSNGRNVVREYYRVAPEIVQAIEEQDNLLDVWREIYGDIRKAVSLVLSKDFDGAFRHYKDTTLGLEKKYLGQIK